MGHLSRFPGTTLDDDRDAVRYGRQVRAEAADTAIAGAVSDLTEAAWLGVARFDAEDLTDADCELMEARARRLQAALLMLQAPA